jgi:hypothetical protein
MANNTPHAGSQGTTMQASKSSSPSRHTVADEATSMVVRNPAPDASPSRSSTETKTFTLRS